LAEFLSLFDVKHALNIFLQISTKNVSIYISEITFGTFRFKKDIGSFASISAKNVFLNRAWRFQANNLLSTATAK